MKKIASKVQRLSQRAAEIRQAIESVPPKIEEVRQVVANATGHVQKLRADILSGVGTLRAETDTQLVESLREIDASAQLLAEAGCHVERVDLDLGPTRRLVVYLERAEDVDITDVRVLLAENEQRPVLKALLSAIIKAEELADKVELQHLTHNRLTVDIGLIPAVRIGWGAETATRPTGLPALPVAAVASPPQPAPAEFGQSSFFARRPASAGAPHDAEPPGVVAAPAVASGITAPSLAEAPVPVLPPPPTPSEGAAPPPRSTALDRFKKMPDLTRRRAGL